MVTGVCLKKNKYYYSYFMISTIQHQICCSNNLELAIWLRMVAEYLEYGKLLPNRKLY